MAHLEIHSLVERIRGEFLEMPGLRLTVQQAARLWGLDAIACRRVIDFLIGTAFLRWTAGGHIARHDRMTRAAAVHRTVTRSALGQRISGTLRLEASAAAAAAIRRQSRHFGAAVPD